MSSPHIRTGVDDGVALIEIARPDKKNALTGEMYVAMSQALQAAQAEPGVPGSWKWCSGTSYFVAK
jgi:enoyl-CoA hydratase/carnithine racemase